MLDGDMSGQFSDIAWYPNLVALQKWPKNVPQGRKRYANVLGNEKKWIRFWAVSRKLSDSLFFLMSVHRIMSRPLHTPHRLLFCRHHAQLDIRNKKHW